MKEALMQEVPKSDYDWDCTREEYIEKMEEEGFVIVYPKPNELQLDIDTQQQMDQFDRLKWLFDSQLPATEFKMAHSKSGEGYHITVTLPFDVTNIERIALQAALGSDPLRELLSIFRYSRNDAEPTLFVERKN